VLRLLPGGRIPLKYIAVAGSLTADGLSLEFFYSARVRRARNFARGVCATPERCRWWPELGRRFPVAMPPLRPRCCPGTASVNAVARWSIRLEKDRSGGTRRGKCRAGPERLRRGGTREGNGLALRSQIDCRLGVARTGQCEDKHAEFRRKVSQLFIRSFPRAVRRVCYSFGWKAGDIRRPGIRAAVLGLMGLNPYGFSIWLETGSLNSQE